MTLDKFTALAISAIFWWLMAISVIYHFWYKYWGRNSPNYTELVRAAPGQLRRWDKMG